MTDLNTGQADLDYKTFNKTTKWYDKAHIEMSICKCGTPIYRYKEERWPDDPSTIQWDHVFTRTYEHNALPVLKEAAHDGTAV